VSRSLQFTVAGVAATKGSGFAVPNKNLGMKPIWKPDNPKTKDWQRTIGQVAAMEMRAQQIVSFTGGVYLEVVFYLPRPKALLTKTKAPQMFDHTKKPDLDKLIRAAKDAMSRIVWQDDSQVVHLVARKRYCAATEFPRAEIRVHSALKESHAQPALV
jgi:Holliday junction resolvase RusA-like endonuclease